MRRRTFLASVAGLGGAWATGCAPTPEYPFQSGQPFEGEGPFPSGVGSADPTSGSVLLWTCAHPERDGGDGIDLSVDVATSPSFVAGSIVAELGARARRRARSLHDGRCRRARSGHHVLVPVPLRRPGEPDREDADCARRACRPPAARRVQLPAAHPRLVHRARRPGLVGGGSGHRRRPRALPRGLRVRDRLCRQGVRTGP